MKKIQRTINKEIKEINKSEPKLIEEKINNPHFNTIPSSGTVKVINFRLDSFLIEKIKNFLTSKKNAGDYQYANLSTFFRLSLLSYVDNQHLTYLRNEQNPKKQITFKLDAQSLNVYDSLPMGSRTEILERILGTYLNTMTYST